MNNQILVLGGTGKTGRRVAERLTQLQIPVRIGSRNAAIPFDWEHSNTWAAALQNIEKVYITYHPDLAVPAALESINIFTKYAAEAGVKKLVLLSGRGEPEAQACEQVIIESGIDYTIVRASWFMQNFSESFFFDSIMAGQVVLPAIAALEPFIDADDIADVVVAALTEAAFNQQILELTGPRLLSFREAVEEVAKATDRPILYEEISKNDYLQMLRQYQTPEDFIWLIDYLFTHVLDGRNSYVTNDVEKVLGRQPADFATYAKKTAAEGIWEMK